MRKIKKGDEVIIITGRDKGKQGKILRLVTDSQRTVEKVVVEGLNLIKKHLKPNPQRNQQGGIVEREAPIHISNVAIFNSMTGKADKVAIKILEDGRKVRIFKSNQELIDV
jgi:large subunit ribosomal protein L24